MLSCKVSNQILIKLCRPRLKIVTIIQSSCALTKISKISYYIIHSSITCGPWGWQSYITVYKIIWNFSSEYWPIFFKWLWYLKQSKHFLLLALKFKNRHRQLLKKHYSDHNNLHNQFHLACTHFSNNEQEKEKRTAR